MKLKYGVVNLVSQTFPSELLEKLDEQITGLVEHIIRIESNELKGSCNESIEFKKNIYSELEECHKYFLNVVNQLRNVLKMQNKNELKNYDSASLASSICSENSSKSLEWDTFVTEQESLSLEENEAMYISEKYKHWANLKLFIYVLTGYFNLGRRCK